jgi:hypothetical protein
MPEGNVTPAGKTMPEPDAERADDAPSDSPNAATTPPATDAVAPPVEDAEALDDPVFTFARNTL